MRNKYIEELGGVWGTTNNRDWLVKKIKPKQREKGREGTDEQEQNERSREERCCLLLM